MEMTRVMRWISFVLFVVLRFNTAQYFLDKSTALKDTSLVDDSISYPYYEHQTVDTCFLECVMDCFCLAFLIHGTACVLLPVNKHMVPLHPEIGTTYYEITLESADAVCSRASCCNTSKACNKDEECEPIFTTDIGPRHRCYCARAGYVGPNCDIPATSCQSYFGNHNTPGEYVIHDANATPYNVTCDFSDGVAWTLIQSYQLQENDKFNQSSMRNDNPISENKPNWSAYRLSKARMASIEEISTTFRITCNYDTEGLVYTDFVVVDTTDLDILTFDSDTCVPVINADIRGNTCEKDPCTVRFFQRNNEMLHVDQHNCTLIRPDGSMPCATSEGEDNFGLYSCINPSHRCSASPTSTTQMWFGGHFEPDVI